MSSNEKEIRQYEEQISQLQREWTNKEEQLKAATNNETEKFHMLESRRAELQNETQSYTYNSKLMSLLEQKNNQLGQAQGATEEVLKTLKSERTQLNNTMEEEISSVKKKMYAVEGY